MTLNAVADVGSETMLLHLPIVLVSNLSLILVAVNCNYVNIFFRTLIASVRTINQYRKITNFAYKMFLYYTTGWVLFFTPRRR